MFFDTGRVDKSLYTHNSVDFTPSFSHGAIATIVVGVMLGLAVLTLLSLPWMAWRFESAGVSDASRAQCCGRCIRSCSASADGSSAS